MKTLAIVSGGMDSTVLAYKLAKQGDLIGMVSIHYGQKHVKELAKAKWTADYLGVEHIVCNLCGLAPALRGSALTDPNGVVPEGHYAAENMKATVVPNRNMILMSVAVAAAISRKADAVAYGAHAGDHAIYPDCRPEFATALAAAVALCDYGPPLLLSPFINYTKAEICRMGIDMGVNFSQTWTCYNGGEISCGRCGTCVERLEAFSLAGGEDPLPYIDKGYWKRALIAHGATRCSSCDWVYPDHKPGCALDPKNTHLAA
jgi:7-cyano-7-deazaguanine synthase